MNYCQFRNETIKRMANAGGITPLLPVEYQEVEYIESTGEQYIDTGLSASNTLRTYCDFMLTSGYSYGNLSFIFGVNYSPSPTTVYSVSISSSTSLRIAATSSGFITANCSGLAIGTRNNLSYRSGQTQVNGVTVSTSTLNLLGATYSIYLFGRHDSSGTIYQTSNIRLYEVKMGTVSDDKAYRHYIPCYRKADNVTGMYDIVTSTFTPYSGASNFIIGNPV